VTGAKGVHTHSARLMGKEGERCESENGGKQRTASTERLEDMSVDIADADTGAAPTRARRHDTPQAGGGGIDPDRV
jgi:hypothetical protein